MITDIRLSGQQLTNPRFDTPKKMVAWMGAIQAQEYNMVKWAIALRLKEGTLRKVNEALERGDIIHTHILRPTWHIVSNEDIRWMLKLSAKRIKAAYNSYDRELDLTDEIYNQSNRLLEKVLAGNKSMTKQEIGAELERVGINTDDRRLNRLIGLAEIDGVLCSGGDKNKKPTYALFEERVPIYPEISKEEALALLALKYFRSHSPATLNDFYWWSGLSMTEARLAINLIKDELSTEKINDVEYFIHQSCCQVPTGDFVHLLPSFDEYLISYKDRTAALELLHHPKAFNNWGIFYPVILCNGRIIGNWKKVTSKGKINIETSFFDKKVKVNKKLLKEAEKNYLNYLNSI